MSHVRQQIREAVAGKVDDITDFGTGTAVRVYTDRVHPITTLPAAKVMTSLDVDAEDDAFGGAGVYVTRRRVTVRIEIRAKAASAIDDTLDALCVKVEEKIMSDDTLGGLAIGTRYQSTETDMDGEAEKPTGLAVITYIVDYRVAYNEPETAIT
jgi:hypothetical protein